MSIQTLILSSSVLILAIIIIRFVFINKVPKSTFSVLWMIAVLRLLIPFSIQSNHSVYKLVYGWQGIFKKSVPLIEQVKSLTAQYSPALKQAAGATKSSTINALLVIWIAGFITSALYFIVNHIKGLRQYKEAVPIENEYVKDWQKYQNNKLSRNIQVRQLDTIGSPFTYGIFKPVILLPKAIDYSEHDSLEHILTHELKHIKRFDILKKWLLAIVLWIYWFNPLVVLMYILANRDIELSCDEAVIKQLGVDERSAYAMSLINLEQTKSNFMPLCNNFSKNASEERIKSIMKMKKTTTAGLALAFLLVIGTTTVFATQPSAPRDPSSAIQADIQVKEASSINIEKNSKIDLDEFSKFGITRNETGNMVFKGQNVKCILMKSEDESIHVVEFDVDDGITLEAIKNNKNEIISVKESEALVQFSKTEMYEEDR